MTQENFFDAVRNDPTLTPEQKEYWLSKGKKEELSIIYQTLNRTNDQLEEENTTYKWSNGVLEVQKKQLLADLAVAQKEIDRYDKVCTEVRNVLSAAGIPELTEDRLTVLPLATRAFLMATASAARQKRVETARSVILRLNRLKHNDGSRSYPDRSDIEAAVAWLEENDWGQSPIEHIFRKRTDVIKETPLELVIVIVANMPIHEQVISFGSYESIARQAQAELRQLEEAENILGKLLDAVANYRIAHSEFEATGIHTTALNDTYAEMLVICDTWLDKQIKTAEKEEEK